MDRKPFTVDRFGDAEASLPPDVLKEVPKEDPRPFWIRLLRSIRFGMKTNSKGIPTEINIKGGADI